MYFLPFLCGRLLFFFNLTDHFRNVCGKSLFCNVFVYYSKLIQIDVISTKILFPLVEMKQNIKGKKIQNILCFVNVPLPKYKM